MNFLGGLFNTQGAKDAVSVIKDPFRGENIKSLSIYFFKSGFSGRFSFSASVKFVNGDTEGQQNFEGNSPDELFEKLGAFLNDEMNEK